MICCVWLCSDSGYNGILPDAGKYATGLLFLDRATASQAEETFTKYAEKYGLQVRGCFQDFSLVAKLEPDIYMEICWRQSDWEHQDYFFLPENCVNYVCQPKTWSIVYFIMRLLFWRGLGSVMCCFFYSLLLIWWQQDSFSANFAQTQTLLSSTCAHMFLWFCIW